MKRPLAGQQAKVVSSDAERNWPAPIGGLNSRDPLASMPKTDALVLDNLICRPTEVENRKGQANFVTGFALNEKVWALLPYRAAPTDLLFAATDDGIYDVTTAGTVGALVGPSTNGQWESVNGSNAGIHYLIAVNGTDPMQFYNGTVWANAVCTGISSTTKFTNLTQFKFRMYFTEKDTLSFWYLAVNAVQGLATEFPLASLFTKGGSLLALGNWTIDGGSGPDDYFVIVTSEGQVAVYEGYDPSDAANWSLVGVYDLPRPIGKKCLFKYGGDIVIITESGLVKLSKVLQSSTIDRDSSISDKIVGALTQAVGLYKGNYGWSLTEYSAENVLILNVPTGEGTAAVQFVMNTLTKSWSMFKAMNAICFQEFGARLFYGMDGKVVQALTGLNDFGNNMTITVRTAFTNFGFGPQKKQIKLLRLNYRASKQLSISLAINVNYQMGNYMSPGSTVPNIQSLWDVSVWDGAYWAEDEFIVDQWRSVAHFPGYTLATMLRITDKEFTFKWNSTDYLLAVGFSF